ncbi:MAG: glycosyltransferase family 61 protein [Neomegalonema sp.]|nr:glycosyltransferase family 61 protein [Neomegalonema sp.]
MGRRRSALRRAITPRQMRHTLSTGVSRIAPSWMRRLNFYGRGVAVEDAAARAIFTDEFNVDRPLRPEQIEFMRTHSYANDQPFSEEYWRTPWLFRDEFFELRDVWMHGHTGVLADPASNAIVTGWGEAENRNRDKAAPLRPAAEIDAVVLPVRRYTSYFHIFFDVALPLVSYFESGARLDAPHVIVMMRKQAPFVKVVLQAISAAYGAELREIGPWEKALCRRAVQFRRTRPAADWYPARPETALRLREILLQHFHRAPEPPHAGLYLERGQAKLRNLANAAEVRAAAERAGLSIFRPEASNFADQIARMAGAQTVFAVHGAALTNILFADPGCRVVEVFGRNFAKSVYLALAHMLGHEHIGVIGGEDDDLQSFEADLGEVDAALAQAQTLV